MGSLRRSHGSAHMNCFAADNTVPKPPRQAWCGAALDSPYVNGLGCGLKMRRIPIKHLVYFTLFCPFFQPLPPPFCRTQKGALPAPAMPLILHGIPAKHLPGLHLCAGRHRALIFHHGVQADMASIAHRAVVIHRRGHIQNRTAAHSRPCANYAVGQDHTAFPTQALPLTHAVGWRRTGSL